MVTIHSKHIGIVAITLPGTLYCYQTIMHESQRRFPNELTPEITIYQPIQLPIFHQYIQNREWEKLSKPIKEAISKLITIGSEVIIIPANTIYYAYPFFSKNTKIPILNILEIVADECNKNGFKKIGILGTSLTIKDKLYHDALRSSGIQVLSPNLLDQNRLQNIIDQLIKGHTRTELTKELKKIIHNIMKKQCEAILLACTDLPSILHEIDIPLPIINSCKLLAIAALSYSFSKGGNPQ